MSYNNETFNRQVLIALVSGFSVGFIIASLLFWIKGLMDEIREYRSIKMSLKYSKLFEEEIEVKDGERKQID